MKKKNTTVAVGVLQYIETRVLDKLSGNRVSEEKLNDIAFNSISNAVAQKVVKEEAR